MSGLDKNLIIFINVGTIGVMFMSNDPSHEAPQDAPLNCPICGSRDFYHDNVTGEVVCKNCGLVVLEEQVISRDKEWRNFDGEPQQLDRATPITNPGVVNGSSSHTRIAPWSNLDGQNKKLTGEKKIEYLRLSRMNNRATGDKASLTRTLSSARSLYTTYKYRLSIPDAIDDDIFDIFTKSVAINLIRDVQSSKS
jgi:transcription initiation factor TFIIB